MYKLATKREAIKLSAIKSHDSAYCATAMVH